MSNVLKDIELVADALQRASHDVDVVYVSDTSGLVDAQVVRIAKAVAKEALMIAANTILANALERDRQIENMEDIEKLVVKEAMTKDGGLK